ncbi:MAG: hypothetical protein Q8Q90_02370 [bacterium]|nr:hypothetical protein [bacterium]
MSKEILKSINVFVRFDPVMEAITGQTEMKIIMSYNAPFIFLLHSIFTSYPEIQRRYPPGKLAMTLNGQHPTEYEFLKDGDRVSFFI